MLYTHKEFETIDNFSTPNTLSDNEVALVLAYLQGMVNLWCTVCGDKPFSARDFIGGENYYWNGTPLMKAWQGRYHHYKENYPNETHEKLTERTHKQSAIDIGHLLRRVLIEHKYDFVQFKANNTLSKGYQWVKDKEQWLKDKE